MSEPDYFRQGWDAAQKYHEGQKNYFETQEAMLKEASRERRQKARHAFYLTCVKYIMWSAEITLVVVVILTTTHHGAWWVP